VSGRHQNQVAGRARGLVGTVVVAMGLGLAACSSGPSTIVHVSTHPGPPARLGSSIAAWQATRGGTGDGGYGSTVVLNGQSRAQFTVVTTTGGKVTGWHQVFPVNSSLAHAEAAVRGALPADARQTASWRGTFAGGGAYCEFVSYQSASLASRLGTTAPSPTASNIGVKFYQVTPHRSGSSSIATVNSAQVSAKPYTLGQHC
jgi:hypothetical protein